MVADILARWDAQEDQSGLMIGPPGPPGPAGLVGAMMKAAGGPRGMVEIAEGIVSLVSHPKTIALKLVELARQFEQLGTQMATLRSELAAKIAVKARKSKLAEMQLNEATLANKEAALAKEIADETEALIKQLSSSQQDIASETVRQLFRDIGALRSQLPRQQRK